MSRISFKSLSYTFKTNLETVQRSTHHLDNVSWDFSRSIQYPDETA